MGRIIFLFIASQLICIYSPAQVQPQYLTDSLFFADPAAHVFNEKIYLYTSHDIKTEVSNASNGDHYNMKDYHVLSIDSIGKKATDHGIALSLEQIPWAGRQLWAPDCVYKNGQYYLYFSAKDKKDIFRIGVAVSKYPYGPFKPNTEPIPGTYSIDPAVFTDTDGNYYMYFGGLQGGQLEHYRNNEMLSTAAEPGKEDNALCPKMARLSNDMFSLAEQPKDIVILDSNGAALKAGDTKRRFFEGAWIHKYNNLYYLSYSTGTAHTLCYAISESPYGPFLFKGTLLTPVVGWTTHHSIIEYNNKWYLFYHDSKPSGGISYLRSVKVRSLEYLADGCIKTMEGKD